MDPLPLPSIGEEEGLCSYQASWLWMVLHPYDKVIKHMAKGVSKKRRVCEIVDTDQVEMITIKRNRTRRESTKEPIIVPEADVPLQRKLVCKTKAQTNYKQKIESSTITFAIGPAGTGKTYIATKMAAQMLDDKKIQRIIVTRPAVGVEEDYGALPGTLEEKTQPWFEPVIQILNQHFGPAHVQAMLKTKKIQFVPLGHLRGLTFDQSFILLDEAQNTTPKQMKALLTRIGEHSKLVVDGDLEQSDIRGESGLKDALDRLSGIAGVAVTTFEIEDIVRAGIIREILLAYRHV